MIRAYRAWVWTGDGLAALTGRSTWRPGQNTARCGQNARHRVPHRSCGCGFWAFKRPDDVVRFALGGLGPIVVGQVWLWGRVVEHTEGWRAEHARIGWVSDLLVTGGGAWHLPAWCGNSALTRRTGWNRAAGDAGAGRPARLPVGAAGLTVMPHPETPYAELVLVPDWADLPRYGGSGSGKTRGAWRDLGSPS
jgi:hypothetical protein